MEEVVVVMTETELEVRVAGWVVGVLMVVGVVVGEETTTGGRRVRVEEEEEEEEEVGGEVEVVVVVGVVELEVMRRVVLAARARGRVRRVRRVRRGMERGVVRKAVRSRILVV